MNTQVDAEKERLAEDKARTQYWKRWGPYLSERQWGTVREDYSSDGSCWDYFPHDHAPSRVYRWGEDGLMGITDSHCQLCFSVALWNTHDPILKERLYGVTGPQGNHGEDVKELYYYLDSTPTHSYMKALYKYPQRAYPYEQLLEENNKRGRDEGEYEITDTGVFDDDRYFDVVTEYAKDGPEDIYIKITAHNRGPEAAPLHLLPTLWFRNSWVWGCRHEMVTTKPSIEQQSPDTLMTSHAMLGSYRFEIGANPGDSSTQPRVLFTDNETNTQLLYKLPPNTPYTKDAFHRYVVNGEYDCVSPEVSGTKAAAHYVLTIGAGESQSVYLRLCASGSDRVENLRESSDRVFKARIAEADTFYKEVIPEELPAKKKEVSRQAYGSLLWTKQHYHYIIEDWLKGDKDTNTPPSERLKGRNNDWEHLFSRDILSMPDKWEYPWFAAWDLAFHTIPLARVDPAFAKKQLQLFLREWYMHPNGQIPAYEFNFSDVNPPVHAWACWRVYQIGKEQGKPDRAFLASVFQKLLINFTWWVNRKDPNGKHLFAGGFLGLDNIGLFDRSHALPKGGTLEQADGTAWMAFFCSSMLAIALELAQEDIVYSDMASKFFEHFISIVDAMNQMGEHGLYSETDGFYYDRLRTEEHDITMRVRSMVGIIPLFAVDVIDTEKLNKLPGFRRRTKWFVQNRPDLARHITYLEGDGHDGVDAKQIMLALPSRERLERVLKYVLDENELLGDHGVRSLSKAHKDHPFSIELDGKTHSVAYSPAESETVMFGGNSNWRGPIWFPLNHLLIESLVKYHQFYGDTFQIECPTGSGNMMNLGEVATELSRRLASLFDADKQGERPSHGGESRYADNEHFKDLILFYEYFHGDNGRGLGASHQTGWTALVTENLRHIAGRDLL